VTLEELVPPDHVSRHLEQSLGLGSGRELAGEAYADIGRPSIDPVVFCKLHPEKVNGEALIIAAGQNLKRLLSWRGWGRCSYPSGAAGSILPVLPPRLVPVP
jgi:hypothetical protein